MVLVRRLPYRTHLGFEDQLRDMQRLMHALASQSSGQASTPGGDENGPGSEIFNPAADVYRDGNNLVLDFELPGVDIDNDVDVEIRDGVLSVTGQRSSQRDEERGGTYLRERSVGRFSRSISLPDGVKADEIEAKYENGVLTICVPLPEDADQDEPRRIEIDSDSKSASAKAVSSGDKSSGDTRSKKAMKKAMEKERASKGKSSDKGKQSSKKAKARKSKKAKK